MIQQPMVYKKKPTKKTVSTSLREYQVKQNNHQKYPIEMYQYDGKTFKFNDNTEVEILHKIKILRVEVAYDQIKMI